MVSNVSNLQLSELYSAGGHLNCCMDKIKNFICMCGSQRVNLRTKLEEEEKEKQQKLALEYVYKLHCIFASSTSVFMLHFQTVRVLLSYNVPSL